MASESDGFGIVYGNANPSLAKETARIGGIPIVECEVSRFADGEIKLNVKESVRGKHLFVIQPLCKPVNENLVELLVMIDALKRASANVTAVIPYYAYARQERKTAPREPITARLVAKLIEAAGVDRVVTFDLHSGAIQGFFDKPVDHLTAMPLFYEHFKKNYATLKQSEVVIVSPDAGGVSKAQYFADRLGASVAVVNKHRPAPNVSYVLHIAGDVEDKVAVVVDDMIDTGGSIVNAAKALYAEGAREVLAYCTHALLSGDAVERIENSKMSRLVVTDTIPSKNTSKKIECVSIAPFLALVIKAIIENKSVSALVKSKIPIM